MTKQQRNTYVKVPIDETLLKEIKLEMKKIAEVAPTVIDSYEAVGHVNFGITSKTNNLQKRMTF